MKSESSEERVMAGGGGVNKIPDYLERILVAPELSDISKHW